MGLVKTLFKLLLLLIVASAVAGTVAMLRRGSPASEISFESWPDVPRNPAA